MDKTSAKLFILCKVFTFFVVLYPFDHSDELFLTKHLSDKTMFWHSHSTADSILQYIETTKFTESIFKVYNLSFLFL